MKLEYIWLDGNDVQLLRSKTKVWKNTERLKMSEVKVEHLPNWNYDGSSTNQAETDNSELILKPASIFINPFMENSLLVMCEVYTDEDTPHSTNHRATMMDAINKFDDASWYGYEQEYVIFDNTTGAPLGWPKAIGMEAYPKPQGDYYCGVGANHVSGRKFVEEHLQACLDAGISVSGINAEVMLGQWEYQVGPVPASTTEEQNNGADQLWVSRYLLYRLGEKYNYTINIEPKPYQGDEWNGSGLHVNFSTKELRENLDKKVEIAVSYCKKLEQEHKEYMLVSGEGNEHRATGKNETASMDKFTWGEGDRTASIRIPSSINDDSTPGYIEDRRPGSNADPYVIVNKLVNAILGK